LARKKIGGLNLAIQLKLLWKQATLLERVRVPGGRSKTFCIRINNARRAMEFLGRDTLSKWLPHGSR
jgi:hypothetical protein